MDPRLRSVTDLMVPEVREYAGLHDYDGHLQDLSPDGVRAGLSRLGGDPLDDPHDEAHLAAFERGLQVSLGELELHRRNPVLHVANLDLACYDREYASPAERDAARHLHLAAWPDGVAMALSALDQVSAPVAQGVLGSVRGLSGLVTGEDAVATAARQAHSRLVAHVERAAEHGDPECALGSDALASLMGTTEALPVDVGRLAERADAERARLAAMLATACGRLAPGEPARQVVARLVQDHPGVEGVLTEARALTEEVMAFSVTRALVPYPDGECLVGPAPRSRQWAMAMMSWAAPGEPEGPSWYHVTAPDPSWPPADQDAWLQVFSRTTLPAVTAHEVAPGHFSHGRAMRHAPTAVRRTLFSAAFVEGWAHYGEELCVEEGFRADDPRFVIGVAVEALVRVTRLAVAIGLHSGAMDVDEAARRFHTDAHLAGSAARSEAARGTFDPTYGRYTWGKLAILDLREQARVTWGAAYSTARFSAAMLALGSPPLGLLGTALERG